MEHATGERRSSPPLATSSARQGAGRRHRLGAAFVGSFLVTAIAAGAQEAPPVPEDLLDFRRSTGDEIRFCINMSSALAEFDQRLAQTIADALLVDAAFFHLVTIVPPPPPYDYRIVADEPEFFIAVHNECDAFMGYPLPQQTVPEWLAVSRPYYLTQTVLAVVDGGYQSLEDIPEGSRLGGRIASRGYVRLGSYLRALSSDRWNRAPYPNNGVLLERLREGTIEGAVIWEPALYLAGGGDPSTLGLHTATLPFDIAPIALGIAVKTDDQFLRELLDLAISSLIADGVLADLLSEHGLPASVQMRP